MKASNSKSISIVDRTRNFIKRVSNGYVLKASSSVNLPDTRLPDKLVDELENLGLAKPDELRRLLRKKV